MYSQACQRARGAPPKPAPLAIGRPARPCSFAVACQPAVPGELPLGHRGAVEDHGEGGARFFHALPLPEVLYMIDRSAIVELEREKLVVAQLIPRLGKHRIEELRRVIDTHYTKRFKGKRRIPKYGSLNKGFTEPQLQAFFRVIDNPKFRLLFRYQAMCGLRIGEVIKLNTKQMNMETRELIINTEKARTIDTLIIPLELFNETKTYLEVFRNEVAEADGYVFFKDKYHYSCRKEQYLESNYVRKVFRSYIEQANIEEEPYSASDETNGRRPRALHRLTTLSLRHYAITRFSRSVNGNLVLTKAFARHREVAVTLNYINTDKSELYEAIERAFS